MNAGTELDATLGRETRIALDHAVLHLDGASYGIDQAAELNEDAIASALHDSAAMHVDRGVDQVATHPPEPRKSALLVGAREPRIAHNVRGEDRRELALDAFRYHARSPV